MKLLLLDLDGTVREPASGSRFIQYPYDQRVIPGAEDAIKKAHRSGVRIIGISNQLATAELLKVRGGDYKQNLKCTIEEQLYTLKILPQIESIYFCPNQGNSWYHVRRGEIKWVIDLSTFEYRKPKPGLLLLAMNDAKIERWDCLYIGDRPEDEQAAKAAGIAFLCSDLWRRGQTKNTLARNLFGFFETR